MPREIGKTHIRKRLMSPAKCARGSFRTIKRGRVRLVVCCPKGRYSLKLKRCRGGMKAQSILKRRK